MLAFVGGGGKTTLAIASAKCAAASGCCVLLTTTTRMMAPNVPEDVEQIIEAWDLATAKDQVANAFADGRKLVCLITGFEESPHGPRAVGIPSEWAGHLRGPGLADVVVVEADGSRKLPFKAPQVPREPVVPAEADAVAAVVGLDCLGTALEETYVCRADVVAKITSSKLGDIVAPEMVGRVLGSGDLWCHQFITKESEADRSTMPRFYAVINKVDADEHRPAAEEIMAAIERHAGASVSGIFLTGAKAGCRGSVILRKRLSQHPGG